MRRIQITNAITNREGRSMESYFNDVSKEPLVSAQEEVLLAQRIRQGDRAALDRLCRANLRFVISIAKKYQHQGLTLADLISEGNVGLMEAARRFDETKGFKFITFAVWWIRQQIMEAIYESPRMVHLPRNKVNLVLRMNKVSCALESRLERQPTPEEFAEHMGISEHKIKEALLDHRAATRHREYDSEEPETELIERLPNPAEPEGYDATQLLHLLDGREQQILRLYFGMDGFRPLEIRAIAPLVGVGVERTWQLKKIAMDKLKLYAGA